MTEVLAQHHALEKFLAASPSNEASDVPMRVEFDLEARFINVRGDPDDKAFLAATKQSCGLGPPLAANTHDGEDPRFFWLGPDEWLLQHHRNDGHLFAALQSAVRDNSGSAADVGDAFVSFLLGGTGVRELLAKGCTLDLHPEVFTGRACAQTLLARADILLATMPADTSLQLVVRRTYAEYLASWLRHAAGNAASFSVKD